MSKRVDRFYRGKGQNKGQIQIKRRSKCCHQCMSCLRLAEFEPSTFFQTTDGKDSHQEAGGVCSPCFLKNVLCARTWSASRKLPPAAIFRLPPASACSQSMELVVSNVLANNHIHEFKQPQNHLTEKSGCFMTDFSVEAENHCTLKVFNRRVWPENGTIMSAAETLYFGRLCQRTAAFASNILCL